MKCRENGGRREGEWSVGRKEGGRMECRENGGREGCELCEGRNSTPKLQIGAKCTGKHFVAIALYTYSMHIVHSLSPSMEGQCTKASRKHFCPKLVLPLSSLLAQ